MLDASGPSVQVNYPSIVIDNRTDATILGEARRVGIPARRDAVRHLHRLVVGCRERDRESEQGWLALSAFGLDQVAPFSGWSAIQYRHLVAGT